MSNTAKALDVPGKSESERMAYVARAVLHGSQLAPGKPRKRSKKRRAAR